MPDLAYLNPDPSIATLLSRHLRQSVYSYGQLAKLSGVPKRTIVNWLDGTVHRPRRWQGLVQLAHALALSAEDADDLLRAAGLPQLGLLRAQAVTPADAALLAPWTANNRQNGPLPASGEAAIGGVANGADGCPPLRAYCRQVVMAHSLLDDFFPPDVPFSFEAVFQDPEVRPLRVQGQPVAVPIQAWSEVRDGLRRAVIVGQPGSGKSWLLRREAIRLAHQALAEENGSALIPFYIEAAGLAEYLAPPVMPEQVLVAVAMHCATQTMGRAEPALVAALTRLLIEQPGRAAFLVDGSLDSAELQGRTALVRRGLELLASSASGVMWMAARPLGYAGPPFAWGEQGAGAELELMPLPEQSVENIVAVWNPDKPCRAAALLQELRHSPALAVQATNPRLLQIYCRLWATKNPEHGFCLCELQNRALALLMRQGGPSVADGSLRRQLKLQLLQRLAWEFATYQGRWRWLLTGERLERLLDELPEAQLLMDAYAAEGDPRGLLWELSAQDGLLVKSDVTRDGLLSAVPYAFAHRALHIFLVAQYLLRCFRKHGAAAQELTVLTKAAASQPEWRDVMELWAAHTSTSTSVSISASIPLQTPAISCPHAAALRSG